jgi:cytochrome P450
MTMAALQRAMFSAELPREELLSRANKAKRHGHFFPRAGATFAAMSRLPYGRELYERLPWPHLAKGRANLAAMVDDVEAMVVQRRADPTDADDLLNVMLGARFEDGSGFTDEDLRWELLTLLFAGFETTAAALAWTLQLLIRNPEALARMRTEVDALPAGPIGAEHVDHLEYVRACFDEGQRIQANIANFRFATRDDVIGGYHVPAGATVVMPMYGLHFDPRFWKRPEEFRPERFLEDEINPHAFIPFGAGPRKCIGVRLAYLEGLLALAEIVRSYELELQPGWSPERDYRLGVWLKSVPVRLTRR